MVGNDIYRKIFDAIYNDIDDDQIRFVIYQAFDFIYIECQPKNLNKSINIKDFSSLMIQYKENMDTSNLFVAKQQTFFFSFTRLPYLMSFDMIRRIHDNFPNFYGNCIIMMNEFPSDVIDKIKIEIGKSIANYIKSLFSTNCYEITIVNGKKHIEISSLEQLYILADLEASL